MNLVRLSDEEYKILVHGWREQCETADEDFETYTQIPLTVFREITEKDRDNTALYGLKTENGFDAICMLNHALIPGYDGPVLRVRHILLSPEFDLGDKQITDYAKTIVSILVNVLLLSENDTNMKANHVKFHARSPADIPFFSEIGQALDGTGAYTSVHHKGSWLYITRTE
jgi:hypothetical protein